MTTTNTSAPVLNPRAKHWCFTWNGYPDNYETLFSSLNTQAFFTWAFYGIEVAPTTGMKHLQGCISFKGQIYRNSIYKAFKKIAPLSDTLPQLIVKSEKSTFQQCKDYCSKGNQPTADWEGNKTDSILFGLDAIIHEYGVMPQDQTAKARKVVADNYAETVRLAKENHIDEIGADHYLKYYKTIKQIAHDHKEMPTDLDWPEGSQPNLWIHGPTGTGKSHKARQLLKEFGPFYSKNIANKWWDKYNGEESVLCEDIDTNHAYQGFYVKIWADKYAFPCEIKNSGDLIRPKRIFITSNYTIQQVFPDPSIHLPLLRRFKVLHMETPWDKTVNDLVDARPITKKPALKRQRKFDLPLKPVPLLMRDKRGVLVPGKQKQNTLPMKMPRVTIPEEAAQKFKFPHCPDTTEESSSSSSSSDLISDESGENCECSPDPQVIELFDSEGEMEIQGEYSMSEDAFELQGDMNATDEF